MVYSDTNKKDGVIQVFERKTDLGYGVVSGDAIKLAEATAIANEKNHEIWHFIHEVTRSWQFDDSNQIDFPSSITDLVAGQTSYALPDEALTVQRVEIKNKNGDFYALKPIIKEMLGSTEYFKNAGSPTYYSLVNGSIILYPGTNYSQVGSLRVFYDRTMTNFLTTDTTKSPGFAKPYHTLLPVMMAIEWLSVKQPQSPTLALLLQQELKLKKLMSDFYSKRFQDYKPRITRQAVSYK